METPKVPEIARLSELLKTQDNRCTSDPVFIVQQKRRIWGIDTDHDCEIGYVEDDREILEGDSLYETYEELHENDALPEEVSRAGYIEIWEFVTACLTEQGCKDYLSINGHNLHEPRIYAASGYRNREWIALREHFIKEAAE